MATVLGAAGNTLSDLESELKRVRSIAEGDKPGIVSVQYTKAAIDKLKEAKTSQDKKSKKKQFIGGSITLLSYAGAAYRDAQYCCRGRKFVRIAGLNAVARTAFSRAEAIVQAEGAVE